MKGSTSFQLEVVKTRSSFGGFSHRITVTDSLNSVTDPWGPFKDHQPPTPPIPCLPSLPFSSIYIGYNANNNLAFVHV